MFSNDKIIHVLIEIENNNICFDATHVSNMTQYWDRKSTHHFAFDNLSPADQVKVQNYRFLSQQVLAKYMEYFFLFIH